MKAELQHKEPQQATPIQSKQKSVKLSFEDNRPQAAIQMKCIKSIQMKNSQHPNWHQEYLKFNGAIGAQGIVPYINHIELGDGPNLPLAGFHAYDANDQAPNHIRVVESEGLGDNSIGRIMWYKNGHPQGQGGVNDPIPVKSSSIFPHRLTRNYEGMTAVRALMKAVAAGNQNATNCIIRGMGLINKVDYNNPPTIYPRASPLYTENFQIHGIHYKV